MSAKVRAEFLGVLGALALAAAVGASPRLGTSEAELGLPQALEDDDECLVDGSSPRAPSPRCALNAIQLRGQRAERNAASRAEEDSLAALFREEGLTPLGPGTPRDTRSVAAAYFDRHAARTNLRDDLTDEEVLNYRLRFIGFVESLMSQSSASRSLAFLGEDFRRALRDTKPAVTEKVAEAVDRKAQGWHAAVPVWAKNLSISDAQDMLGAEPDNSLRTLDPRLGQAAIADEALPEAFDSRERWPKCRGVMSHIRNQGLCNSCWAHAAASSLESRLCVVTDGKFSGQRAWISAAYITACYADIYPGHDGCSGGNPGKAMERMARGAFGDGGVPTGSGAQSSCVPSVGSGNPLDHFFGKKVEAPPCPTQCTGKEQYPRSLQADKFYASGQVLVSQDFGDLKRAILTGGPVPVSFTVYNDFMLYMGGYYDHAWGQKLGMHATAALGWKKYKGKDFIVGVNQWGSLWGEGGFFTMAVDCCDFEYYIPQVDSNQDALPLPGSSEDGVCRSKTGGTCIFRSCHQSRGPTSCEMGQCVCRPGYCSENGACVAASGVVLLEGQVSAINSTSTSS